MKRLGPSKTPFVAVSVPIVDPICAEAPQVNLSHVDTQLNMLQHPVLEQAVTSAQTPNGILPIPPILPTPSSHSAGDRHVSQPSNRVVSDTNRNAVAGNAVTAEWSAVGHAATGKSGRVIHNLQEEIARLTRECTLQKSRAEEYQRMNEAYKIQQQNMNERLKNLEQVNDTNLNSIARKDRKIEDLRVELDRERSRRGEAEKNVNQTNHTMLEEREIHNREQARIQEIAKYHQTQYEVLVNSHKRDKADFSKRINAIWGEIETLCSAQQNHIHSTERLEVLADQKNREIDVLKESYEKLLAKHTEYKDLNEKEVRGTINAAKSNNTAMEDCLTQIRETEMKMRWVLGVHASRQGK